MYSPQNAPAEVQPGAPMSPQQLDDLVAPIALYPDPLVAEVLAASTYPMEIAEAEQWVQDHPKWKPSKLMDEAKKQNWDPSVQGLVAFPDVLARLTQNMSWTTQLGNAFLAQQADVMQAVQRMRAQAEAKGTLRSTPQETVTTQNQNGQPAITIEPANPDVWYVPNYNPAYVWGPPVWGAYPPLLYPGIDVGLGWYPGIDIGLYFGGWGGWGWGGWGWDPELVRRQISSSTILSFIVTVSVDFTEETAWAVPPGRMIRSTGSACRMAIARWPPVRRNGAFGGGCGRGRRRRRQSLGRGEFARRSSALEVRVLSSAAGRAITVSSAVITTAG